MNTQAQQILNLIRDSGDRGVENYKLVDISLKYSSRIAELRKAGNRIVGIRQKVNGHMSGTWKYFIEQPNLTGVVEDIGAKIIMPQRVETERHAQAIIDRIAETPEQKQLFNLPPVKKVWL
jgi:hypothetical protein